MKIRLSDIPREGLPVEFPLDLAALNARVSPGRPSSGGNGALKPKKDRSPDYSFAQGPVAELLVTAENRTIQVEGRVSGSFQASCSRCAEDVDQQFDVPVQILLKPHSERARPDEEVEDLQLGYYDGHEFDSDAVAQEFVILALPYKILCRSDCRGLCSVCGKNLNVDPCSCIKEGDSGDDRFAVLKQLKLQ